jgi:peptidoglycan/LPS O-acetylase OafA/YrhL
LNKTATTAYENNFNLLRLVAAIFVIISHSFGILNKGLQQPALWYSNKHLILSDVGLFIFFSISGFLVTQSLFNSDTMLHYLCKRFLRIVPALAIVNVVCIIMGGFITTLSVGDYYRDKETWMYFLKNTTLVVNQFTLPGVFTPLSNNSVNASLWTILLEVKFYLLLLLAAYPILTRKWLFLALFILFQGARVYINLVGKTTIYNIDFDVYFTYGTYFYLGSLYYCFKDDIPLKWFYANILMAIALLTVFTIFQPITEAIFFAYCILTTGTSKAAISLKDKDFSFGLYLYAFPIQQLVLLCFGYEVNVWLHIVLSVAIAFILAVLSRYFVEKPFLKMKHKAF